MGNEKLTHTEFKLVIAILKLKRNESYTRNLPNITGFTLMWCINVVNSLIDKGIITKSKMGKRVSFKITQLGRTAIETHVIDGTSEIKNMKDTLKLIE